MAAKYPRVKCPVCGRPIAGVPTKRIGVVSVADHKPQSKSLVLCPGSEVHVQAPGAAAVQEELDLAPQVPQQPVAEQLPAF
jgi:hypothetical protein